MAVCSQDERKRLPLPACRLTKNPIAAGNVHEAESKEESPALYRYLRIKMRSSDVALVNKIVIIRLPRAPKHKNSAGLKTN